MINLLPFSYKKVLERLYLLRVLTVLFVFLGVAGIIASIFILPAYVSATLKEQTLATQLDTIKKSQVIDTNDSLNQIIKDINQKLTIFPDPSTTNRISKTVVVPIVQNKTAGITLSEIFYAKRTDGSMLVTLAGVAKDRATLLAFQKVLEADPHFKNVTLPISNFIKDTNINFSLEVSVI